MNNEAEIERLMRSYDPPEVLAETVRTVHLVGAGGTGMGTLAGMLKQAGYGVTGSDQKLYPPMSDQLADWGIPVVEGFAEQNLSHSPDLVVIGNVCRPTNPEARSAILGGLSCTSLPRALRDLFIRDRHSVVVAGTHGKTTVTSMIGWLLVHAGMDPGVLIGGVSLDLESSFRLGDGGFHVVEGDEYDSALFDKVPKFVHYRPCSGILTSVEFDHADIYDDLEAVKAAFRHFARLIPKDGRLLVADDAPAALEVTEECAGRVIPYGRAEGSPIHYASPSPSEEGMTFRLFVDGQDLGEMMCPVFGDYNVANCTAAAGLAVLLGASADQVREGLAGYRGVKRRQEIFARIGELVLVDDFAHHPTAIEVTLRGISERFAGRRLVAIFEPRSNTSRRSFFQDRLPRAFDSSHTALLRRPFGREALGQDEALDADRVVEELRARGKEAHCFDSADQIVEHVVATAEPRDIIVVMSNGGFDGIHGRLAQALSNCFGTGAVTDRSG